ncbi:MAG: hypothetical protein Q7W55_13100 [Pseudohongiella sp.]|nr:hypothetical protein [Pseudohongiella sp.]MDO9518815.1 hypothetical protein [Pseudohongiella sp.]MDP2128791.1 hypothetical protein [Pseudohongiella sp.]
MKTEIVAGKYLFFLLATLTTMVACTTTPQLQQAGEHPGHLGAMDFYLWATAATPGSLRQEQTRLESNTGITEEHESLVQLALLVSATTVRSPDLQIPRQHTPQEQRALALLDEFEQHARTSAVRNDYLALADLWRQVLEMRLQVYLLREQIEALTTIERKIDRREPEGG